MRPAKARYSKPLGNMMNSIRRPTKLGKSTMKQTSSKTRLKEKKETEYEKTIKENNRNVDDTSVKRLLSQKKDLSALQVGRIVFLNICRIANDEKQLYTIDEYVKMLKKLQQTKENFGNFIFYQRLASFALNVSNDMKARNVLALNNFKYLKLQLELIKKSPDNDLIDKEQIMDSILEIREVLQSINTCALIYDAIRSLLKNDRRLTATYRITPQAREVMKEAKDYDKHLESLKEDTLKKYNLNYIGEIPRVYTEHKARPQTIEGVKEYLVQKFDYRRAIDNVTTGQITLYISSHFPRD